MQSYKDLNINYKGGDLDISSNQDIDSLDGCPDVVSGDFNCEFNYLTDLAGSPNKVTGSYTIFSNKRLTSLTGAPTVVNGDFVISRTKITNLNNIPEIHEYLNISENKITSLVGSPNELKALNCSSNDLTSLDGGPQIVSDIYWCNNNLLTDLVGCASNIGGTLLCWNNEITSLVGIHKIIKSCPEMSFDCNSIKVGGIGLLLIENLADISSDTIPFRIIKSYLGTGTKGMMECRAELIEKGYDDYAKL